MQGLLLDFRHLVRTFAKHPIITVAATLSLALGIAANTVIFGMINGILLKPLNYRDASELVLLWERHPKTGDSGASAANFVDWRASSRSFAEMAAVEAASFVVSGQQGPERIEVGRVSESFFDLLGVDAALGRTSSSRSEQETRDSLVVLTDRLWKRRFGADPRIIGSAVRMDDRFFTVAGVLPAGFRYHRRFEAFVSLEAAFASAKRDERNLTVLARLRKGVNVEQAQTEMRAIARNLAGAYPDTNRDWDAGVEGLQDSLLAGPRADLPVMMAAALFLLLICCANVANLMMAQAAARREEMALRAALGAGRARLLVQLLMESVALALVAGVCALPLAAWALRLIERNVGPVLPDGISVSPEIPVFGFALAAAILAGTLFGLPAAWRASRADLQSSLKHGFSGALRGGGGRLRGVLIAAQLTLSLVLLCGSALMVRALYSVTRTRAAFEPERILTLQVALPESRYRLPAQRAGFFSQAVAQMSRLPGVESAAISTAVPFGREFPGVNFHLPGHSAGGRSDGWALFFAGSPEYFPTLGTPLLRGRLFTERDNAASGRVVIVNQSLARLFPPGSDPLGQTLLVESLPRHPGRPAAFAPAEIVGVIGEDRLGSALVASPPQIYAPYQQNPTPHCFVVLRTSPGAPSPAAAAAAAVQRIDPDQPVSNVMTMDEMRVRAFSVPRLLVSVIASFGGFALVLTMIAVYALVSYSAAQRTRELGLRMALGSSRARLVWVVMRQAAIYAAGGLIAGLAGAWAIARLLRGALFGVPAGDMQFLAGVVGMLALLTLAASFFPARRASKLDPLVALRAE